MTPSAFDYWGNTDTEFSVEHLSRLVRRGDELIEASGGYVPAVRQIQDVNLKRQSKCAENVWEDRSLFPAIAEKLHDILTVGVVPEFYGKYRSM